MQNLAQAFYRERPMMDMQHEGNGWIGIIWMVFWIAIISVVLMLLYRMANKHVSATGHREPLEIAKERFAKGEITKDELAEIKKELKS